MPKQAARLARGATLRPSRPRPDAAPKQAARLAADARSVLRAVGGACPAPGDAATLGRPACRRQQVQREAHDGGAVCAAPRAPFAREGPRRRSAGRKSRPLRPPHMGKAACAGRFGFSCGKFDVVNRFWRMAARTGKGVAVKVLVTKAKHSHQYCAEQVSSRKSIDNVEFAAYRGGTTLRTGRSGRELGCRVLRKKHKSRHQDYS